jgi:hypothetical protein
VVGAILAIWLRDRLIEEDRSSSVELFRTKQYFFYLDDRGTLQPMTKLLNAIER